MRTIKFRGKRVDNGEWAIGMLHQYQGRFYISKEIIEHPTFSDPSGTWIYTEHEIHPETVGQFTGLHDKDGNEIYEGDVLKEVFVPLASNPKIIEYYKIGVAVWPNGFQHKIEGTTILNEELKSYYHKNERKIAKHPTQGEDWIDNSAWFYKMQIIGNIHDNPELIKEDK